MLRAVNQEGSLPESVEGLLESLDRMQGAIGHIRFMLGEVLQISMADDVIERDGVLIEIELGEDGESGPQGVILLGDGRVDAPEAIGVASEGSEDALSVAEEVGELSDRRGEYAMLLGLLLEKIGVGETAPLMAKLDEAMGRDAALNAKIAEKVSHLIRALSDSGSGKGAVRGRHFSRVMDNEVITVKVIALDCLLRNVRGTVGLIMQYVGSQLPDRNSVGQPQVTGANVQGFRREASKAKGFMETALKIDPKAPRREIAALPDDGSKGPTAEGLVSKIDLAHTALRAFGDGAEGRGMEKEAEWLKLYCRRVQDLLAELLRYTELATRMDATAAMEELGTIAGQGVKIALQRGLGGEREIQGQWAQALGDMQVWIAVLKYQMDSHHAKIQPLVGQLEPRQVRLVMRRPMEIEKKMEELQGGIEKAESNFFGLRLHLSNATQKAHGKRIERMKKELESLKSEHREAKVRCGQMEDVRKRNGEEGCREKGER
jgi:hypothetical protein